jgi:hypothetical protein
MTAAEAGWPAGESRRKVEISASIAAAGTYVGGYEKWLQEHPDSRPDLVLPLANGLGLRRSIGQRGDPLILHATTSPAWLAQLHRHLAGLDDCIDCRLPDIPPQFNCSTAPVNVGNSQTSEDAALPFVSAASGLLLATELLRLGRERSCPGPKNIHWIDFKSPRIEFRRGIHRCREGCDSGLPLHIVREASASSRWVHLLSPRSTTVERHSIMGSRS